MGAGVQCSVGPGRLEGKDVLGSIGLEARAGRAAVGDWLQSWAGDWGIRFGGGEGVMRLAYRFPCPCSALSIPSDCLLLLGAKSAMTGRRKLW